MDSASSNNFDEGFDERFRMFGLTDKQSEILFSIEKELVERDIDNDSIRFVEKKEWLNSWLNFVLDYLSKSGSKDIKLYETVDQIDSAIQSEASINQGNNTWYYLLMLEATFFVPYTPLGKDKKDDRLCRKLKYSGQEDYLKEWVKVHKIMDPAYIDRFRKTYSKSLLRISGKTKRIAIQILIVVAVAAIVAAGAGAFAGPIAVALVGGEFELSGAALVSACLALIGGGAIAAGGGGMALGVLVIVAGGALLGGAAGGTAVGVSALFIATSPNLALTQAAKLEVVLKEIILNAQQDVKLAQDIIQKLKQQIVALSAYLEKLELEIAQLKAEVEKMKKESHGKQTANTSSEENIKTKEKSIKDREFMVSSIRKSMSFMKNSVKDLMRFLSSYKIGFDVQGD